MPKPSPDPIEWVECPECGEQQADLGVGVRCEACGWGPMPSPSAERKKKGDET